MRRTCSASRHAVIIATQIERVEKIEDPQHAAESIRATAEALWKERAENNELLEALRWIERRCPAEFIKQEPHVIHTEAAHDAGACARAAIAKAEGK